MPVYRSDIKVELLNHYGTDQNIAEAAWVSSAVDKDEVTPKRLKGLINSLMRQKHGTPFESGYFEFRVEAPRAVRDEAVRHRSSSFSCESLRYAGGRDEFYIPPPDRPLLEGGYFKKMRPLLSTMEQEQYNEYVAYLKDVYYTSSLVFEKLHDMEGMSTEGSRWVTLDGSYTAFIMRCNPRSLMHFIALRTHSEEANHISYPMWEIEQMANQMEDHLKEKLPITWETFNTNGREAP